MKKLLFVLIALLIATTLVAPAFAQEEVAGDGWSIAGDVPQEVVPLKYENGEADPDSCEISGACWIFNAAGVLSAADRDEAEANESAVWSGAGDVQELLEGKTAELILPENGYLMAVGAGFDVSCDGYDVSLEASEDHAWFFLVRGLHEGSGDRNVVCTFTDYTAGAVLVTMYAIPVHASAFFSEGYFLDNVENAHVRKNCGSGGCQDVSAFELDINDGAYAVQTHEGDGFNGFELVETNTVAE